MLKFKISENPDFTLSYLNIDRASNAPCNRVKYQEQGYFVISIPFVECDTQRSVSKMSFELCHLSMARLIQASSAQTRKFGFRKDRYGTFETGNNKHVSRNAMVVKLISIYACIVRIW